MSELDTKNNKLLFLCTGNSCRSQIAEAIAKKELSSSFSIESAGTEAHGLNPYTIKTLKEINIDISNNTSKAITDSELIKYDLIITLCGDARDKCPILDSKIKHIHWDLKDPANFIGNESDTLQVYSKTRELIYKKIINLKNMLDKGNI